MFHQEAIASHSTPEDHSISVPRINTSSFPLWGTRLLGEQGEVSACAIEAKMVQVEVLDHRGLSV